MERIELAVVGGGAAGMMAASTFGDLCRRQGRPVSVMLLEGADRVGKKLLSTGNGRCNLTNLNMDGAFYHGNQKALLPFLKRYPPERVLQQFRKFGLLCRPDREGRVYPYCAQASAVSDVLRRNLAFLGVVAVCQWPVVRIRREGGGFSLENPGGERILAEKVILSCGGAASAQLGCSVGGYRLAQSLGHTVTALSPALVPITVRHEQVKALKGIRCRASVSLYQGKRCLRRETGEVQFADGALSGICVFQLSRLVGEKSPDDMAVIVDLLPDYAEETVLEMLKEKQKRLGEMGPMPLLEGFINKRAAQEALKRAGVSLNSSDLPACVHAVKHFRFDVTGTMDFRHAQVTSGGVPLQEVRMDTMASCCCRNLYLAGEMLDVDGDCGGYNLHWAWSTGMAAGAGAAK